MDYVLQTDCELLSLSMNCLYTHAKTQSLVSSTPVSLHVLSLSLIQAVVIPAFWNILECQVHSPHPHAWNMLIPVLNIAAPFSLMNSSNTLRRLSLSNLPLFLFLSCFVFIATVAYLFHLPFQPVRLCKSGCHVYFILSASTEQIRGTQLVVHEWVCTLSWRWFCFPLRFPLGLNGVVQQNWTGSQRLG